MKFLKNTISWLNRPMPFFETTRQKLIISISFGISIIVFLFFFDQPPAGDKLNISLLKIFAYGFITFFVLFFFSYFMPKLLPRIFYLETWTVGKSLLFGIVLIISIGLANTFFAFRFDNPNKNTEIIPFLFAVVYRTFIIGLIPSIIFHFWLERKLYKDYSEKALKLEKNIEKSTRHKNENKELVFQINNKGESLALKNKDLVFVKSEGNYCQIFYNENSSPQKLILRNTLKSFEEDLKCTSNICRCHKSFIINLDYVLHVKGNARGYYFIVDVFNYPVPVSRDLSKELFEKLSNN